MRKALGKLIKIVVSFTLLSQLMTVNGQSVPEGFELELLSDDWAAPVGVTYAENGYIYVWEASGKVWVIENGEKDDTPSVDISEEVAFYGDLGMLGFTLDPDFLTNGYVYLLYALDTHYLTQFGSGNYDPDHTDTWTTQIGRVSRLQLSTSDYRTVVPGSKTILIGETAEDGIAIPSPTHGVGSLIFGSDGSLLVTAGEGTTWVDFYTGGDPVPEFGYDDNALDQNMLEPFEDVGSFRSQLKESLNGKLLRIDPQTGFGYPSNPFYDPEDPDAAVSKVWAMGLRNPFRMTLKPNTGSTDVSDADPGTIYIGDVGLDKWEELNVVHSPGLNFGWPRYEGMIIQPGYEPKPTENILTDNPLHNGSTCNVEHFRFRDLIKQPNEAHNYFYSNPCDQWEEIEEVQTYVHERPTVAFMNTANSSSSTTFVPGYDSDGNAKGLTLQQAGIEGEEFNGISSVGGAFYNSVAFPEEYFGAYFHADFSGWINAFWFDENDELKKVEPFLQDLEGIVHLSVNPYDGCLYFPSVYSGRLYRVCYAENLRPIAEAEADVYYGPSPLTVQFDGSASFDPDNDPITYSWDFGDTGTSDEVSPEHIFTAAGTEPEMFEVKLSVTDTADNVGEKTLIISLNNTPPVVEITSFEDGDLYALQQATTLPLEAAVTDLEHDFDELTYTWQTYFHHNTHFHPQPEDHNVSTTTFIQPAPCEENLTYYYRIKLEVRDAAGLTGVDEKIIYPDCNDTIPPPPIEGYILYPNPGTDYLTLKGEFGLDPVKISIFNSIGQSIRIELILPERRKNLPIEIFQLRSGVYIMKVEENGESESIRFVKTN